MKLWQRYSSFLVFILSLILVYILFVNIKAKKRDETVVYDSYYKPELIRFLQNERQWDQQPIKFDQCSMSTCFNYSKCLWKQPKVYVYPTDPDVIISPVYETILRVIRDSLYYTEDAEEACLFVLSLDTTDRDRISDNYIKDLSARIDLLPNEVWNEGRNHIIFNLYYGSYPDYSQKDIGFVTGYAILAWASAGSVAKTGNKFREDFDISFPLFHKEHPLRVAPQKPIVKSPDSDQYLSSFKGKRYVYGIGSSTRDHLYHLHNKNSTIILTTCRHNTDWKKFEDSRCAKDNQEYDNYDYVGLLENSSFCLTPRGRRLGSFRFLEALKAGCIPVILSDGWELPFSETIEWSHAAIRFHERAVFFTTDTLNSISSKRIARMKLHGQLVYHQYFASVEKIVLSTIKIVLDRLTFPQIHPSTFNTSTINQETFTVALHATKRFSNRLTKIIDTLSSLEQIKNFIVLWPKARGSTPEQSAFSHIKQHVEFVIVDELDQENLFNLNADKFQGSFVLAIDERIKINNNAILKLMDEIKRFPDRLITYHALQHQIQPANETSKVPNFAVKYDNASFSIGLLHLAVLHRDSILEYAAGTTISRSLKRSTSSTPQCSALLFNVFMAEKTLMGPMLLNSSLIDLKTPIFVHQNLRHYSQCLNKIIRSGYENPPFLTSNLRLL